MINTEVLEIRKQFTPEKCNIARMCGCLVDPEKVRKYEVNRSYLSLPEEEAFKYFEIFKQTLSGTLGKKLINMTFPLEQEEPGGTQEFLYRLKQSKLEDESLVDALFTKIIENYEFEEHYYIIMIYGTYDVPGRATDGAEMFDASDQVYDYLLCSICPVKLSKAGLSYDADQNSVVGRNRDWVVSAPEKGFLFPAFNDRSSDIHQALYFSKKAEELQPKLIEELLGSEIPLSAEGQKISFNEIITTSLGEECDYTMVRCIHENLQDMIEESKDEPEPLVLDKFDMRRLLEESGASQESLEAVEPTFQQAVGETRTLLATNVVDPKKVNIQTPDVVIKVNSEQAGLVETKVIDGKRSIVITINDHVEVNGMDINIR